MTVDEVYAFLVKRGWKYEEIRKLTAYQIRNHIQKAEQDEADAIASATGGR